MDIVLSSSSMGDLENASSRASESYDSDSTSTESVTSPMLGGDEVLGEKKMKQPATNEAPTKPRFPFDMNMTFREFEGMEAVKDLEEDVKRDYYHLCRYAKCLPHGFSNNGDDVTCLCIRDMVQLSRDIKAAINVEEEDVPKHLGNMIRFLDRMGFTVDFLASVVHRIAEQRTFFKRKEKRRSELEAKLSKFREELCKIDEQIPKFEAAYIEFKNTLWGSETCCNES